MSFGDMAREETSAAPKAASDSVLVVSDNLFSSLDVSSSETADVETA